MSLDALRLLHEAFALKAEPVLELVKVFRRTVSDEFVTELPKVFSRLQFGRVGWLENSFNASGYNKLRAGMRRSVVHDEQDMLFG